jgi:hypothetical protein
MVTRGSCLGNLGARTVEQKSDGGAAEFALRREISCVSPQIRLWATFGSRLDCPVHACRDRRAQPTGRRLEPVSGVHLRRDRPEAEREDERRRLIEEAKEAGGTYDEQIETARKIAALKQAIEDLEDQLGIDTGPVRPRAPKVTRRLGR